MRESGFAAKFPTQAARLLRGMRDGVKVDFEGDRDTKREGPNLPVEEKDRAKVSAVIDADVATLKKAGPFKERPPELMVSPIGAVPKKDPSKIRVIHHLSYPFGGDSINANISDVYAPISGFGDAARVVKRIGRGCLLVKLDVEAAYKQIPVRREDWHLLGFKWNGAYYYERVLPFGLKSSCRLWDEFAQALHYFFEWMGVDACIHYIDDFLFVFEVREHAEGCLAKALALCKELGIPMADDKTEGPTTRLTFLGIELDTESMRARLPDSKLAELKERIRVWRSKSTASIKDLQSIAGMLAFAAKVVPAGKVFLRGMFAQISDMQRTAKSRHVEWPLSPDIQGDLRWWHDFIEPWNGVSLLLDVEWSKAEKLELYTDACGTGLGALFGTQWFAARWTPEQLAAAQRETKLSMPWCELYAVVAAARTWGAQWSGKKIMLRSDCMPVVQAIKAGRSRDPGMADLMRHLVRAACEHNFEFDCDHIEGVKNIHADELSRAGASALFFERLPAADKESAVINHPPLRPTC